MNLTIPNKLNKEHTFQSKKIQYTNLNEYQGKSFILKFTGYLQDVKNLRLLKKLKLRIFLYHLTYLKLLKVLKTLQFSCIKFKDQCLL